MKYSDLVQFEPIESVVQLRLAGLGDEARRLVETFVISKRMAEQLTEIIFPQLQFESPADNVGLLVVGNYGTGKSHLMSVISNIAERADLIDRLTNTDVAQKASQIAGRFKVIREEIGATTMPLREIICGFLEKHLGEMGIQYRFPAAGSVAGNKDAFHEMMAAFQQVFPGHGLMLLLDELLDYLRARNEQELVLDLSFLREVGEVSRTTRFRFVAGLQESLFDTPRFQFVADTLRRVKDRFEQVRIAREDVSYVVSERLLKKDARQQALVREHLLKFTNLYDTMNERIEEFVRLFPVHPAYLETFERVYVAEKREVLKSLSATIRKLMDQEVPADAPGLTSYDSYWQQLKDNVSFRAVPEIRQVIDKSDKLEGYARQAFSNRPQYRAAADRIVQALSVHRLSTGDIRSPLGLTAAGLRDGLALMLPVPERDADFLKTVIESILRDIIRAASGQFISFNPENGQYYLDPEKDIDYDEKIRAKAGILSEDELDRHYFSALARVMECTDQTYRTGFRIWEHEVEWKERHVGRSGYLFFGAPNERPNTAPPRDFYLYFMDPYKPSAFKDQKRSDEVFFRLKHRDEAFETALRLYAGAGELASTASGSHKSTYEGKAGDQLKALTAWLRQHLPTACEVTHQGRSQTLIELVKGSITGMDSVRDLVNAVAATCLAPHFSDLSPDYPAFNIRVTRENRAQSAQEALRWIAGSLKNRQGAAVLDALELLDGEVLKPRRSRYAKQVLLLLDQRGPNQVLNRVELISDEYGIEYWAPFRLEPEFLVVVLAALVHSGDLVISLTGRKLDASAVEQFGKISVSELVSFKHVERPKDLPMAVLQELFDLLSLPPGLIVNPATREDAVQKLRAEVEKRVAAAALAEMHLGGLTFWDKQMLSEPEVKEWSQRLAANKQFLESLLPFNTEGKLKNLPWDAAAVGAQRVGISLVRSVEDLTEVSQRLGPLAAYLSTGEAVMPAGHPWRQAVAEAHTEMVLKLTNPASRSDAAVQNWVAQRLQELRAQYKAAYLALHRRVRLDFHHDQVKGQLAKDARLTLLQSLSAIQMMPTNQLQELENSLFGLRTCRDLRDEDLDSAPTCPHCQYRPVEETETSAAAGMLDLVDERLDKLVSEWTATLVANLADPTIADNISLLTDPEAQAAIRQILTTGKLPDPLSAAVIRALQEVFSGLQKVVISRGELLASLAHGGMPCTVAEFRQRFDQYLGSLTKGKDPTKVRVITE